MCRSSPTRRYLCWGASPSMRCLMRPLVSCFLQRLCSSSPTSTGGSSCGGSSSSTLHLWRYEVCVSWQRLCRIPTPIAVMQHLAIPRFRTWSYGLSSQCLRALIVDLYLIATPLFQGLGYQSIALVRPSRAKAHLWRHGIQVCAVFCLGCSCKLTTMLDWTHAVMTNAAAIP